MLFSDSPDTAQSAARCDLTLDQIGEYDGALTGASYNAEKYAKKDEFIENTMKPTLGKFDAFLGTDQFFAGDKVSLKLSFERETRYVGVLI